MSFEQVLCDLPTELRLEISHYCSSLGGLGSLAQASRRLYESWNCILYEADARSHQRLALHWGAVHGLENTVRSALVAGTPINTHSVPLGNGIIRWNPEDPCDDFRDYDYTPFYRAAQAGHTSIMAILIEQGAAVTWRGDKWTWLSPLAAAAGRGHVRAVQLLLQQYRPSSYVVKGDCWQALKWAVRWGHCAVVKLLLDYDESLLSDFRVKQTTWFTDAATQGHYDICNLLLARGLTFDADAAYTVDVALALVSEGKTADSVTCADRLLQIGANVNQTQTGKSPVAAACRAGNLEMVEMLLQHGADLSIDCNGMYNPFLMACCSGNTALVQRLLSCGVSLECRDDFQHTALHIACMNGYLEMANLLIDHGADLASTARNGKTPFQSAFLDRQTDVVLSLLRHPSCTVNQLSPSDVASALRSACLRGDVRFVELVLDANMGFNLEEMQLNLASYISQGLLCIKRGMPFRIVQLLLKSGATLRGPNVNEIDRIGNEGFRRACATGDKDLLRLFASPLFPHVDYRGVAWPGTTPLYHACESGQLDMVQFLVDLGVNVRGIAPSDTLAREGEPLVGALRYNFNDSRFEVIKFLLDQPEFAYGLLPDIGKLIKSAAGSHNSPRTLELLLSRGADHNYSDTNGETALHMACIHGNYRCARILLERGANPSPHRNVHRVQWQDAATIVQPEHDRSTPLHVACRRAHPALVELLLAAGADVNARRDGEATPLHDACKSGNALVCKLMIDGGADIAAKTSDMATPVLSINAKPDQNGTSCDNVNCYRILLDAGADVWRIDRAGRGVLHKAAANRDFRSLELLLDLGDLFVNLQDRALRTPLDLVRRQPTAPHDSRDFDIMINRALSQRLLLDHGALASIAL